MSNSEPNPDRCQVTLLPLHIVRPGRFLKTNPLIARKESEKQIGSVLCRHFKYFSSIQRDCEENASFAPCILLLSIKPPSSLSTVAGAVAKVKMFSSRYQLRFSSNTVAKRWNSLS